MVKSTILILAGAGIIGTGSQAVAPQSFELSAGAISVEVSGEGVTTKANENPELGVTILTKGNRQFTLRF